MRITQNESPKIDKGDNVKLKVYSNAKYITRGIEGSYFGGKITGTENQFFNLEGKVIEVYNQKFAWTSLRRGKIYRISLNDGSSTTNIYQSAIAAHKTQKQ